MKDMNYNKEQMMSCETAFRSRSVSAGKQEAYQPYLSLIKGKCVAEWEDETTFFSWLQTEMELTPGRKLIRFTAELPYGPENCMLDGSPEEVKAALLEKFGCDPLLHRRYFIVKYGKQAISDEWKSRKRFICWLFHYEGEISPSAKLCRMREESPLSPSNFCFMEKKKEKEYKIPLERRELYRKIDEIRKDIGINFLARYNASAARSVIDPAIWPKEDFLKWACELYDQDVLYPGMHMHKIDPELPFARGNVYFSWRKESKRSHGMSFTKLYEKWGFFRQYYKDRLDTDVPFEDFMEHALVVRGYQLNQELRTEAKGETVTLENVYFVDTEFYDDVNRVCSAYSMIPREENGFSCLMEFMEWSIRSGYTDYKDFRKVGEGVYSPKTCVWDIFTQENYEKHYRDISPMVEGAKKMDFIYRKRANLKASGAGIAKEWNDLDTFRSWCEKNRIDGTCKIVRIDKSAPYGPENVLVVRDNPDGPYKSMPYYLKYKNLRRRENFKEDWGSYAAFHDWCDAHSVKNGDIITHIDSSLPIGPDNASVVHKGEQKPGISTQPLYKKYVSLRHLGNGSDGWGSLSAFIAWYENKKLDSSARFKRIDKSKPFGPDNVVIAKKETA